MTDFPKLLRRQLDKLGLSTTTVPNEKQWVEFLEKIAKAYDSYEEGHYLLERSLQISSDEMQTRYQDLKEAESFLKESARVAKIGGWKYFFKEERLIWTHETYRIHGLDDNSPLQLDKSIEFYIPEHREMLIKAIEDSRENGSSYDLELQIITTAKKRIWIRIVGYPQFENNKVVAIFGTLQDIDELKHNEEARKELQMQLVQAGKLSSIGALAANVVHELNNPLTAIFGFSEVLQELHDENSREFQMLEKMVISAKRMGKIIDQLRKSARNTSKSDHINISPLEVIYDSLVLLNNRLKILSVNLSINSTLETGVCILGEPIELASVVQNLITNSLDAFCDIPESDHHERFITIDLRCLDGRIIISHTDNAGGMPKKVMDQIFDPFFTTKEIGKGTGIGMSLSKNIVESHRGDIKVESEENCGTTFTISFPISLNGHLDSNDEIMKKILIIDDEPYILEILNFFLGEVYQLTLIDDPHKGLGLIDSEDFDLIISDYNMPQMLGTDVIDSIVKSGRHIPIILISGNVQDEKEIKDSLNSGTTKVIYKPFTSKQAVLRDIKCVLDSAQKK